MSLIDDENKGNNYVGCEMNREEEKKSDLKESQEQLQLSEESIEIDFSVIQEEEKEDYNQIIGILSLLSSELSSLSRAVETRLSYDDTKEKAFERLYAELDELKKNSAFEQIRPLYMDLILLFDRVENTQYELSQSASIPITLIKLFNSIRDELVEILSRREIELIKNNTVSFDPVFQRAIGTHPTFHIEENNQIDRIVRRGFLYRDRVFRAEEVIVKKYTDVSQDDEKL